MVLLEGGSVTLMSFFHAGWCFKLTEQLQELKFGKQQKWWHKEESISRKTIPMQ